jgi:DNA-binding NarL/FixJ family response regulator
VAQILGEQMQGRILIVEDHPLYAEAISAAISGAMPQVRLSHAASAGEAQSLVSTGPGFDLVLLDLWLPDVRGFDGLIGLRVLKPALPIVIITAFCEPGVIHNAVRCGAAGFISKSAPRDKIVFSIREVLAGNVPLPNDYHPPQAGSAAEPADIKTRLGALTYQQMRVLQMMCQGKPNKLIAHELGVGETTVKAHVSEILRKLGVYSRTQAVLGVSKAGRLPEGIAFDLQANDARKGQSP